MSVNPIASNAANVQAAIAQASRRTGVDFSYLIGQAQVESGLRTNARATTSSASGLYQFIEQSWLGVVKAHGAEHGLGWAAASIQQTPGGRYVVSDAAARRAILSLRNDPQAASLMAAEHASDNKAALEAFLGREATGTDLYMAHFLGLGGAKTFLSAMAANPGRAAAALFPSAARANRNIFYAADGSARSLEEIYQRFAAKLDRGAAAGGATELASRVLDGDAPAAPGDGYEWSRALAAMGMDGEVVLGSSAADGDRRWIETTLANLNVVQPTGRPSEAAVARIDPLRPTPDTARLAYLMLASLGA